jgi:hemerythrin-like domain-containing protein
MSALTSLTDEHQMIVELLGALQTYATRLRSGANVDPADLARFSEVFRELVDYRHHEKEEGIVFPFLARNGFEWSSGLLAELHGEHGHLRYLIDVLCQAATRDLPVSREQRRQIAEAAAAFVDFKRRHIHKEESLLIPAIAQRLGPGALEQLTTELRQFDLMVGRGLSSSVPAAVSTVTTGASAMGASTSLYQQASELVERYSMNSGTVDVTGVIWTAAAKPAGSPREMNSAEATPDGSRAWRDVAATGFTSFGRSR